MGDEATHLTLGEVRRIVGRAAARLSVAGNAQHRSQRRQKDRHEPLREDETGEVFEEEMHNPGACYKARLAPALSVDRV
jgi:hypothetical protein